MAMGRDMLAGGGNSLLFGTSARLRHEDDSQCILIEDFVVWVAAQAYIQVFPVV